MQIQPNQWPSSNEYQKAILNAKESLKGLNYPKITNVTPVEVKTDSVDGSALLWVGGFGYVWKVKINGTWWAIKGFQNLTQERGKYELISQEIIGNMYLSPIFYNTEELEIEAKKIKVPIITCEWREDG